MEGHGLYPAGQDTAESCCPPRAASPEAFVNTLPDEIKGYIFRQLEQLDAHHLRCCCKEWRESESCLALIKRLDISADDAPNLVARAAAFPGSKMGVLGVRSQGLILPSLSAFLEPSDQAKKAKGKLEGVEELRLKVGLPC